MTGWEVFVLAAAWVGSMVAAVVATDIWRAWRVDLASQVAELEEHFEKVHAEPPKRKPMPGTSESRSAGELHRTLWGKDE
jgi:hypothetical protein